MSLGTTSPRLSWRRTPALAGGKRADVCFDSPPEVRRKECLPLADAALPTFYHIELILLSSRDRIPHQGRSTPADNRNSAPLGAGCCFGLANPAVPSSAARFVSDPNLGAEATQPSRRQSQLRVADLTSSRPYWPLASVHSHRIHCFHRVSPVRTTGKCGISS